MPGPAIDTEIRRTCLHFLLGSSPAVVGLSWDRLYGRDFRSSKESLANYLVSLLSSDSRVEAEFVLRPLLEGSDCLFEFLVRLAPHLEAKMGESVVGFSQNWDDWIQSSWGFDYDTILGLSLLHSGVSEKKAISLLESAPRLWEPLSCDRSTLRSDSHIHVGALVGPGLIWMQSLNLGIFAEPASQEAYKQTGLQAEALRKRSLGLRRSMALARILLSYLLDLWDLRSKDGRRWAEVQSRSSDLLELLGCIHGGLDGEDRLHLANHLRNVAGDIELPRFEVSLQRGVMLAEEGLEAFTSLERSTVHGYLRLAANGQLDALVETIFTAYIRTKNYWFYTLAGGDLQSGGLRVFRYVGLAGRASHADVRALANEEFLGAVSREYSSARGVDSMDLRLPIGQPAEIPRLFRYLERSLDSVTWSLFVSIKRTSPADGRTQSPAELARRAEAYISSLLAIPGGAERIAGIDIVGTEMLISWEPYLETVARVRAILDRGLERPHVSALHCGEDTPFALKGILDILYMSQSLGLGKGDRIGHGLDLLDPSRLAGKTHYRLGWWQMNELARRRYLDLPGMRGRKVEEAWAKVLRMSEDDTAYQSVVVPGQLVDELALEIQPIVQNYLLEREISIETCPTSNWRVGRVKSPLRHPAQGWRERGGKMLVGTDDPAVFPCTIAGEWYCLENGLGADPR